VRVAGGWGPLTSGKEHIPLTVGREKHIPFLANEAGPGRLIRQMSGLASLIIWYTVAIFDFYISHQNNTNSKLYYTGLLKDES